VPARLVIDRLDLVRLYNLYSFFLFLLVREQPTRRNLTHGQSVQSGLMLLALELFELAHLPEHPAEVLLVCLLLLIGGFVEAPSLPAQVPLCLRVDVPQGRQMLKILGGCVLVDCLAAVEIAG